MNDQREITNHICISDLHINSTVALSPPSVSLDDGGTYHASRGQRWLWECWLDFIAQVKSLVGRKVLIINGDLGELDTKRRSNQLITPNKSTILSLVIDTLAPLADVVDRIIIIRGTMAHTGKSQWIEEAIARQYDHAVHNREADTASWYHFRGMIGDARIDAAHHISMGRLPWTAPNSAHKLAARVMWAYRIDYQMPPPHYAYRAHNHRYADSGDNYECKAILMPCWTLLTEFSYRVGGELELADIGGIINGKPIRYTARPRRIWSLKI